MLTKRQKQALDFIKSYTLKKGVAPSLEEIKGHLGLSSVSTAHHHVRALEDLGYLIKEDNQPRAIGVMEKELMVSIPMLGSIVAGKPIEGVEVKESIAIPRSQLPRVQSDIFALKVTGNSMVQDNIHDGDIVIVKQQQDANNGDRVVALVDNNEVTLKRFYREADKIRLQPANPSMEPIFVKPENVQVQGKVVNVVRGSNNSNKLNVESPSITKLFQVKQSPLFYISPRPKFPSTRFQGSKSKLTDRIWQHLQSLSFNSAIDLFGGTGAVGYILKEKGKQVFYNDYLRCNYHVGRALIENSNVRLDQTDLDFVLSVHHEIKYPNFIEKTFHDIYFTNEENRWLDVVVENIKHLENEYKQSLAYFSLFQSCIIKRPYNLFHRKNLYVRFADVERSFGNKASWDKPFDQHFLNFATEANSAVFDNGKQNHAFNKDAFDLSVSADLVYVDTPYINKNGVSVNYLDFYHFLEGLVNYEKWPEKVNQKSKHKKFKNGKSVWDNKNTITNAFDRLFEKYKDSILVVSYRSDGIPSPEALTKLLLKYKSKVTEAFRSDYRYALSKNGESKEILLIAE